MEKYINIQYEGSNELKTEKYYGHEETLNEDVLEGMISNVSQVRKINIRGFHGIDSMTFEKFENCEEVILHDETERYSQYIFYGIGRNKENVCIHMPKSAKNIPFFNFGFTESRISLIVPDNAKINENYRRTSVKFINRSEVYGTETTKEDEKERIYDIKIRTKDGLTKYIRDIGDHTRLCGQKLLNTMGGEIKLSDITTLKIKGDYEHLDSDIFCLLVNCRELIISGNIGQLNVRAIKESEKDIRNSYITMKIFISDKNKHIENILREYVGKFMNYAIINIVDISIFDLADCEVQEFDTDEETKNYKVKNNSEFKEVESAAEESTDTKKSIKALNVIKELEDDYKESSMWRLENILSGSSDIISVDKIVEFIKYSIMKNKYMINIKLIGGSLFTIEGYYKEELKLPDMNKVEYITLSNMTTMIEIRRTKNVNNL